MAGEPGPPLRPFSQASSPSVPSPLMLVIHLSAANPRPPGPCPSPAEDMQVCQGRGQPYLERNEEVHGLPDLLLDGLAKVSGQLQTRPL